MCPGSLGFCSASDLLEMNRGSPLFVCVRHFERASSFSCRLDFLFSLLAHYFLSHLPVCVFSLFSGLVLMGEIPWLHRWICFG